jgi:hypothetical protein
MLNARSTAFRRASVRLTFERRSPAEAGTTSLSRWLQLPWPPQLGAFWPCCCHGKTLYSLGGCDAFQSTIYATCDKTDFNAETTSAKTSANLSQARYAAGAAGNPATAGYIAGGASTVSTYVATADKLLFGSDTTSAQGSANLSQVRAQLAALSERTTKAYFAGGLTTGTPTVKVATADKLTFASDTSAAQTSAKLSQARAGVAGINGNSTKGYFAGGTTGGVANVVKTAERIAFASDTTSALASANLSKAREMLFAGSDGSTKGYWCGGQTGAAVGTCDKIAVSTDTTSNIASGATISQYFGASGSDGVKLLCLGGNNNTIGTQNGGNKMTFATDTSAALGSGCNLSSARQGVAGVSTAGL